MRIIIEWIYDAPNPSAEEAATLCDLRIMVSAVNACRHLIPAGGAAWDSVTPPAVHLAEGIVSDWDSIFDPDGPRRSIQPYRTGYVLPPVEFS